MARRVVVLAAGLGTRLRSISGGRPKLAVKLEGKPLLYYPLAVAHSVGVAEACIVAPPGWREEALRVARAVYGSSVYAVVNPEPLTGNGYSLYLGLECIGWSDALVSMTDHLYTGLTLVRVLDAFTRRRGYTVGVDAEPSYVDLGEATRVETVGEVIVSIGKQVEPYTGVDVGVHAVEGLAVRRVVELEEGLRKEQLSRLVQVLADRGEAYAAYTTGAAWTEIDTPSDYEEVVRGKRRAVLDLVLSWLRG